VRRRALFQYRTICAWLAPVENHPLDPLSRKAGYWLSGKVLSAGRRITRSNANPSSHETQPCGKPLVNFWFLTASLPPVPICGAVRGGGVKGRCVPSIGSASTPSNDPPVKRWLPAKPQDPPIGDGRRERMIWDSYFK